DTPGRVARFYQEFLGYRPLPRLTTFDAEHTDEMIVLRGVPFFSLCEHHLLPFVGTATVGYVPTDRIEDPAHRPPLRARVAKSGTARPTGGRVPGGRAQAQRRRRDPARAALVYGNARSEDRRDLQQDVRVARGVRRRRAVPTRVSRLRRQTRRLSL